MQFLANNLKNNSTFGSWLTPLGKILDPPLIGIPLISYGTDIWDNLGQTRKKCNYCKIYWTRSGEINNMIVYVCLICEGVHVDVTNNSEYSKLHSSSSFLTTITKQNRSHRFQNLFRKTSNFHSTTKYKNVDKQTLWMKYRFYLNNNIWKINIKPVILLKILTFSINCVGQSALRKLKVYSQQSQQYLVQERQFVNW